MSGTYEDLEVWREAMSFVVEVYRATNSFPKQETYGLSAQLRRASISIPSNIAEGKGPSPDKELLHFLSNARGSLYELQTQVTLAHRLGLLNIEQARNLSSRAASVGRLLNGFIRSFHIVERAA